MRLKVDYEGGSAGRVRGRMFAAAAAVAITLGAGSAPALTIRLVPDTSVGTAPAGFLPALQFDANLLQDTYSDPITINVNIGWGEVNGNPLSPSAIGQSSTSQRGNFTYPQVRTALIADAKTANDRQANSTLPPLDPTGGRAFRMSNAEAKALGLLSGNATGTDGWIGFSSTVSWTFDPDNRGAAGAYDFIGVGLHELTEVMGRYGISQNGCSNPVCDSPIDLFRYTAPGTLAQNRDNGTYFSLDGGSTNINTFDGATGDYSDWFGDTLDAFNAHAASGRLEPFTTGDRMLMDVIGYDLPEPATGALLGTALAAFGMLRRRRGNR